MTLGTPTSLVASGSGTDTNVYTTASISPAANALLLLFVSCGHATTAETPSSITGTLGLTWTLIDSEVALASNQLKGSWYWAKTTGSPPTGTVQINFATTHSSAQWHIDQFTGADLTSPIVQHGLFQTTSTDDPAVTLPSAIGAGNATMGASVWNNTTALPVGSGYTLLSDSPSSTTPSIISSVEYKSAGSTTVGWTTTANNTKVIFAIEVKAGASAITQALPVATGAGTAQTLARIKTRALPVATEAEAAQALAHVRRLPVATEAESPQVLGRKKTLAMPGVMNWLDNARAEAPTISPWTTNDGLGFQTEATAVTRDTSQAHSGVASVKAVWPASALGSNLYQGALGSLLATRIRAGKSYTFSGWVYVPSGSPDVQATLFFVSGGSRISAKDTWTAFSWSDVIAANHAAVAIQTMDLPVVAGGVVYADDMVFTETGTTPPVDTAQSVARKKTRALPVAVETEASQTLTRTHKYTSFGGAQIDDALPLARSHTRTFTPGPETETAQALVRKKRMNLEPVLEHELAQPLEGPFARAIPLPVANEMILNPRIEQVLEPWTTNDYAGDRIEAETIERSSEAAHSGSYSVKVGWPETATKGSDLYQLVTGLNTGETYVWSAWVLVPSGSPDVRAGVALKDIGVLTSVKGTWTLVRTEWLADDTSAGFAIETSQGSGIPLGSSTYADDFSLLARTQTATPMGRAKSRVLPVAVELDAAIGQGDNPTVGIAPETEQAVTLVARHTRALSRADEVGISRVPTRTKTRSVLAPETETARPLTRKKKIALPVATEIGAARPIATSVASTLAQWYVSNGTIWELQEEHISNGAGWINIVEHVSNGLSWG